MTSQAGVLEAEQSTLESGVISRLDFKHIFKPMVESNEPCL